MAHDDPEATRARPFDIRANVDAPSDLSPEAVEVVTDALVGGRHDGVTAALVRADAPWGFQLDVGHAGAFAAVTSGVCWLRRPRARPVRLKAGDLTFMPRPSTGFGLASTSQGPLNRYEGVDEMVERHATTRPRAIDLPGDGPGTSIICGSYAVGAAGNPLLHSLPLVVHLRSGQREAGAMLEETLRLLAVELSHEAPAETVLDRLVDVLFVHTVRTWLSSGHSVPVAHQDALGDHSVTRAVAYIHADPARRWTTGQLAADVGLSRATFVRRFTASVGEPPMTYLTRWRLGLAARRLRDTDEALAAIALDVGYGSEFTFSRAFSRIYGQPPGRYRADQTGPGPSE